MLHMCSFVQRFLNNCFREFLKDDPIFYVPEVIKELSSKEVLTTELVSGVTLDKLETADQETRDMVSMFRSLYLKYKSFKIKCRVIFTLVTLHHCNQIM